MKKEEIISKIKTIIDNYGSFKINEVDGEAPIVLNTFGNDANEVIEYIHLNGVDVVSYVNETETDDNNINYYDLSENILLDILRVCELYETDQEKTIKRCSN